MVAQMNADADRTLEQVEDDPWGDPPPDATRLVRTVYQLRRKPLGLLGAEDLRELLGQRVGAPTLVPWALDLLERDPLAEGDFYPGDLLVAVLALPTEFWVGHAAAAERVERVLSAVRSMGDLTERDAPADTIAAAIGAYHAS